MANTHVDHRLARYLKRIFLKLFANVLFSYVTIYLFVYGIVVLILRTTHPLLKQELYYGLFALPILIAVSYWKASKQFPKIEKVKSLLDLHNEMHGQLMSEGAFASQGKFKQWESLNYPEIEWKAKGRLNFFALACLFLMTSFLIPLSLLEKIESNQMNISEPVETLQEQLNVLKEEEIIEEERKETLAQDLKRIEEQAKNDDPGQTWEALDKMSELLQEKGQLAASEAAQQLEKLTELQTFAKALDEVSKDLEAEEVANHMEDLNNMMKDSRDLRNALMKHSPEMGEAMKKGMLKNKNLSDLIKNMQASQKSIEEMLKKLEKNKLIDQSQLSKSMSKGEGGGEQATEALKDYIKSRTSTMKVSDMMKHGFGKGGITRGPGTAPITWDQNTKIKNTQFKAEALPLSQKAYEDGDLIGVTLQAPKEETPVAVSSGALKRSQAGGGGAQTQVVLPKHRGALERYFSRESKK